jgi:undecaprenyl-diphosphatase
MTSRGGSVLEAVVLGLIQGLTEFVPISSIAHLRIVPALLGWEDPGAAYSAVLQLGTLLAVLVYFGSELGHLIRRAWGDASKGRPFASHEARLVWYILLGTVPIGVFGLVFQRAVEHEARSLYVIAASLIGVALLLVLAERVGTRRVTMEQIGFLQSQAVGLCQALALVPGSSRAGTTIVAGLFVGMTRETAARFSFLLGVPAIAASGLYELRDLAQHGLHGENLLHLIVATAMAAASGYLSIDVLIRYLKTHTTYLFVWYRVGLGVFLLFLLVTGRVAAL